MIKAFINWVKQLFAKPNIDRIYYHCSHCNHNLALAYGDTCPNCGWAIWTH